MTPSKGFAIKPDELYSHARAVAQMQQPLDRVVAAMQHVSVPGISVAYGVLCQLFAQTLVPVGEEAHGVVANLSRAVDSVANQLNKAVDTYVKSDEKTSQHLRKIGEDLPANVSNGLIVSGTTWTWENYSLVTSIDNSNWAKGAGVFDDFSDFVGEIGGASKRNYGAMVGYIASMGVNVGGFIGDPIASGAGWAAGWVIEHIGPFKVILDGLAGNPVMVNKASSTWNEVKKELDRLANHYALAIKLGAGGWDGEAGESYRQNAAHVIVDAMKASANLAEVMSIIVGTTGELVDLVRTVVRDLAAQAIGVLTSAAAQRFLGYKPPFEALSNVRYSLKTAKAIVTFLIVLINEFGTDVSRVVEAYKTVAKIIPKLNGV
jgi:excreted virulence factor EspC (type VII ESX diderm)